MRDTESAAAFAIAHAKKQNRSEIGKDELLLGCLQTLSQFGVVQLGPWTFDLEELGVDWLEHPERTKSKVGYSQAAVDLFDRAARISKADGFSTIQLSHLLAAFAAETEGLMGALKRAHGISSANWRVAVSQFFGRLEKETQADGEGGPRSATPRDYLTPEEAAEALNIHVQTLRAYVRTGKLRALRLAGERAIRIRRADLEEVLEPLVPQA